MLGPVRRNYIIQIPKGLDNNSPVPMVLDLHGWTGSAQSQTHQSGWKQLGNTEKFIVIWPDGMDDSPSKMGSWNCSMSTGKTIQEKKMSFQKNFTNFLQQIFFVVFQGVSRWLSLKNKYFGVEVCQSLNCQILVKMAFQIPFLEWS